MQPILIFLPCYQNGELRNHFVNLSEFYFVLLSGDMD
jgi:hypothetical protein